MTKKALKIQKKSGKKDSQLLIRINGMERDTFVSLCEVLDTSAAREIRRFIRSFIQENEATGDDLKKWDDSK